MAVITFQQALDRLAAFEAATESDVGRRVSTLLGQGLTAAQKAAARANIGAAARDEVVLKRGRQTVFGDVTFERPVGVPAGSIPQDRVTDLTADLASKLDAADVAGKADADSVVDLTTAQTVAGVKTFSAAPVVPDAAFAQAKIAGLVDSLNARVIRDRENANPLSPRFGAVAGGGISDAATNSTAFQACSDYAIQHGIPMLITRDADGEGEYYITPSRGVMDMLTTKRPGRGWFITGGKLRVQIEPGVTLRLPPSDLIDPTLLQIWDADGTVISGGTWIGERYEHIGTTGESGYLIGVGPSSDVTIENVTVKNSWGDGISTYCFPGRTVPQSGSGYTLPPVVTITPAPGDTTGSGATATAVLGNGILGEPGTVDRFNTTAGSGYTKEPIVTIVNAEGDTTGSGAVARAILKKDGTGRISGVNIVDSLVNRRVVIRDFSIENPSRNGITVGGSEDVTIERGSIVGANRIAPKFGIDIEPDGAQAAAFNVAIRGVVFKDNVIGGVALGGGNGADKVSIDGCVFANNGCGFSASNAVGVSVTNSKFTGGPLAGLGGAGWFSNCADSVFSSNHIDLGDTSTVGKTGIGASLSNGISITGNVITRCHRGINAKSGTGFHITDNVVSVTGGDAVRQETATDSTLSGNTIRDVPAGMGANFLNATTWDISGNTFRNIFGHGVVGTFTNCSIQSNLFVNWGISWGGATGVRAEKWDNTSVVDNVFLPGAVAFYAIEEIVAGTSPSTVRGNTATYTNVNPFQKLKAGTICDDNILARESAAPTTRTWLAGQTVLKPSSSLAAGASPGWQCVTAGTPGTWVPLPPIGATDTLAHVAPNTSFRLPWNGTDWTYNGVAVGASRPSARTDVYFDLYGATAATPDPAWMLANDSRTDV